MAIVIEKANEYGVAKVFEGEDPPILVGEAIGRRSQWALRYAPGFDISFHPSRTNRDKRTTVLLTSGVVAPSTQAAINGRLKKSGLTGPIARHLQLRSIIVGWKE